MKIWELVYKIKHEYIGKFGNIVYDYNNGKSCLENWIEEIGDKYYIDVITAINIKQDGKYLLFKYKDYQQLFYNDNYDYNDYWNLFDGIYRECRGLVLDIEKEEIVCLPFQKFFNIDEQEETSMQNIEAKLKKAKIVEFSNKLDGTLIESRCFHDNIFTCTSGSMDDLSYQLRYAKKTIASNDGYKHLMLDYKDWTCLFECITSQNHLTVLYKEDDYGLYLIGMRNVMTGELKSYSEILRISSKYDIRTTSNYLLTFEEILESRNKYKASEKEGYVMYFDGTLVKIKCDEYILLHKKNNGHLSSNSILKMFVNNELDDVLGSSTTEEKELINQVVEKLQLYCKMMEEKVDGYMASAPKERIAFYEYIRKAPKEYRRYLDAKYNNRPYSYLIESGTKDSIKYVKFATIENWLEKS